MCRVGTNHVELLLRSGELARASERFAEIAPRAPAGRPRRMLDVLEVRLAIARGELDRARRALDRARTATGHGIESDARVACAAAELAIARGDDPTPALAEAERLADALGVSPTSDLRREIDRLTARAGR